MFMLVITVQAGRQADDNLNSLVYYYLSVNGKPARFFLSFFGVEMQQPSTDLNEV
jgi:hypothetical protein